MMFEEALEKVKPAATAIICKLRDLRDSPDEVIVEFGLKMNANAEAIIASASAEANYWIELKWSKSPCTDQKLPQRYL